MATAFLDGHASQRAGFWVTDRSSYRIERAGNRTVVLLVGANRFVSGTVVRNKTGFVYVEPPAGT